MRTAASGRTASGVLKERRGSTSDAGGGSSVHAEGFHHRDTQSASGISADEARDRLEFLNGLEHEQRLGRSTAHAAKTSSSFGRGGGSQNEQNVTISVRITELEGQRDQLRQRVSSLKNEEALAGTAVVRLTHTLRDKESEAHRVYSHLQSVLVNVQELLLTCVEQQATLAHSASVALPDMMSPDRAEGHYTQPLETSTRAAGRQGHDAATSVAAAQSTQALKAALRDMDKQLRTERTLVHTVIDTLREMHENNEQQLKEQNETMDDARGALYRTHEATMQLEVAAASAEEDLQTLRQKITSTRDATVAHQTALGRLKSQKEDAERDLRALKAECSDVASDLARVEAREADTKDELRAATRRVEAAEADVAAKKKERQDVSRDVEGLAHSASTAGTRVASLEREVKRCVEEAQEHSMATSKHSAAAEEANAVVERLTIEKSALDHEMATVAASLHRLEHDAREQELKTEAVRQELDSLPAPDTLETELKGIVREINDVHKAKLAYDKEVAYLKSLIPMKSKSESAKDAAAPPAPKRTPSNAKEFGVLSGSGSRGTSPAMPPTALDAPGPRAFAMDVPPVESNRMSDATLKALHVDPRSASVGSHSSVTSAGHDPAADERLADIVSRLNAVVAKAPHGTSPAPMQKPPVHPR